MYTIFFPLQLLITGYKKTPPQNPNVPTAWDRVLYCQCDLLIKHVAIAITLDPNACSWIQMIGTDVLCSNNIKKDMQQTISTHQSLSYFRREKIKTETVKHINIYSN